MLPIFAKNRVFRVVVQKSMLGYRLTYVKVKFFHDMSNQPTSYYYAVKDKTMTLPLIRYGGMYSLSIPPNIG